MKENFKERLKMSVMRTIVAIVVLLLGIKLGTVAMNWQEWTSVNSEVGFTIDVYMYCATIVVITYGVYLISPIYTAIIMHKLINWLLDKTRLNDPEDQEKKEVLDEEKNFRKKIIKLQKKYLW